MRFRRKKPVTYNPMNVRPKKHLGQHFLIDENIAAKIAGSLVVDTQNVLEIGPGKGVLTKHLLDKEYNLKVIEIDKESVDYLSAHFPQLKGKIISGDFLRYDLSKDFSESYSIIGNFPYNISSQILFNVLKYKGQIPEVVGMFQKEVAERIASPPGNKQYGILSVLLKAYYDIEYLFTVSEHVFQPPPKVKSAVIRLTRHTTSYPGVDEKLFFRIVKAGFNQRRKTLRNSLKNAGFPAEKLEDDIFSKRAEQLSVDEFLELVHIFSD